MTATKLVVVITDYDGWQQTKTCLHRLQSSSYSEFEVVIVDHGSGEETAAGLRSFPNYLHIRGESDLWWSGATNLGIREALGRGATHIMLLNNDCFVDASTLQDLMSKFDNSEPMIVAPVQRASSSGDVLVARAGTCFSLGFPTIVLPLMRKLGNVDCDLMSTKLIIGGRGAVIPATVFEEVGMLDEKALPHYGADHDFYLRCRARGIPLFVLAGASVSVDDTRTTIARRLGDMNWGEFKASLRDERSHRNWSALATLFRRYYPVRFLYPIGLFLNIGRYFASFAMRKLARLARIG